MNDELLVLDANVPLAIRRSAPTVTVLGDFILDGWWSGPSERMCREAPAPVIDVDNRLYVPGGAANTAMNFAAMGARVHAVGLIGDDETGQTLRELLNAAGINTAGLVSWPLTKTTSKVRVVGSHQIIARVDDSFTGQYPDHAIEVLIREALKASAISDAEVICDYGSTALTADLVDALARRTDKPGLTVVDAHNPAKWSSIKPTLATPNAAEAAQLLNLTWTSQSSRVEEIKKNAKGFRAATGAQTVVVTLDRDGTIVLRPDGSFHRTWALPTTEKQASGAGDTYVAALTLARLQGLSLGTSADCAQIAADIVVKRFGTSVCSTEDLVAHLSQSADILDEQELLNQITQHRAAGLRIVLTNGCFDVLHRGHVSYLNQARQAGDILIVAVNGDDSVRRLKGPTRPVNSQADRAALLSALASVDYVTVFDSDTPIPLLRLLQPEIYAKGGDYTVEMLAESKVVEEYGGEVRILDYVTSQSTTQIVDRIMKSQSGSSTIKAV